MVHKVFRVLPETHKGSKEHKVLHIQVRNLPLGLRVLKEAPVQHKVQQVLKVELKGLKGLKDPLQTRD
jgi:hypothetical protein